MPWRMTRGCFEPYFVAELAPLVDQFRQTTVEDWPDRIIYGRFEEIVSLPREKIPLRTTDQVLRIRKSRNPFAVLQRRVPTHMIDVQMGADDLRDSFSA